VGRYITSDPIGLDAKTLNVFAYVDSNPVNWFDPNGLERRGRNRTGAGSPSGAGLAGSIGAGGGIAIGPVGGSATSGVIFDTNGRRCVFSRICGRFGIGAYIGGGVSGSAGVTSTGLCSGKFSTLGVFAAGGLGLAGSGSLSFSKNGAFSGARGIAGAGVGIAGGLEFCEITLICDGEEPCNCK